MKKIHGHTLFIGRARHAVHVASIAEAQEVYARLRDESGEGASKFPDGRIESDDGRRLRISYNGRVWDGDKVVQEVTRGR